MIKSAQRCTLLTTGLLVGTVGLLLTACAPRESAVEVGNRTKTLHIGNGAEPPNLDPHTNNSLVVGFIHQALFEGLVRLAPDGATVLPGAAESWEISADGRRYTFALRPEGRWSNGDPLTAHDFVAGMRRFMTPALGCEAVNVCFPIVGARDYAEGRNDDFSSVGVTAPDDHTLVIRLRHRTPYFLSSLTKGQFSPAHRPSMDAFDAWAQRGGVWTQPGNLVSNGPFFLHDWQPNEFVAVDRNSHYWNADAVKLQAIHFHPIENKVAEEHAFRAGQIHVTVSVPASRLRGYRERQDPRLVSIPILSTRFITFGTQQPPWDDPRVRRAFSLAIDRERIAAAVLPGMGEPAWTYAPPQSGGYDLPALSQYDPAEAQRLLAEAGYPGGAGFPAEEFTLPSRDSDMLNFGQALQQAWRETLGVDLQLAPMEFKVWIDMVRSKTLRLSYDSWFLSVDDPVEVLALGVTGDPNNSADWRNEDYDAAFAQIELATNEAERAAAILACEQIIADQVPYAPAYHDIANRLVHPSVQGWHPNAVQYIDWTAIWLQ